MFRPEQPEGTSEIFREISNKPKLPFTTPSHAVLDRVGSYLAAFGNHEAKALTLVTFLNTYEVVDRYELNHRLVTSTGGVWRQHYVATEAYCQGSLQDIGAVTVRVIDKDLNLYGYSLTQDGLNDGQPMAAFFLLKEYQYSQSLYETFGATVSFTENRSPAHSFAILNAVAISEVPLTREELIRKLGMYPSTLSANLRRLAKTGILSYQAHTSEGVGKSKYKVNPDKVNEEPKPVGTATGLTRGVWGILRERLGVELSMYDVAIIIRSDPDLATKFGHLRSLEKMISTMLGGLRKQEFLITPFRGLRSRSRAEFAEGNENARKFVEDVFPKLIAFVEGNPAVRQELTQIKNFVISDSTEAKNIRRTEMERALEKSPNSPVNIQKRGSLRDNVYNYLQTNPLSRPIEISTALGLTPSSTLRALNDLLQSKDVVKARAGRAVRYNIAN